MRSPRTALLTMIVLALTFHGCKDSGDPVSSSQPLGTTPVSYSYRAYNAKGLLVVTGSMTLALTGAADPWTVSGNWALECVAQGEQVGPQTGTGSLIGHFGGAIVNINLNPGWIDNNVLLSRSFDKNGFSGTWMWSTFIGTTSQGTFNALRTQ